MMAWVCVFVLWWVKKWALGASTDQTQHMYSTLIMCCLSLAGIAGKETSRVSGYNTIDYHKGPRLGVHRARAD